MVNIRDEILKKILDNMTVSSGGVIRWEGFQSSEYNRYLFLLIADLMLDNHFQKKLNSLRYYFTAETNAFFGNELNSIFKELKLESKSAFSDFKEKLDLMLKQIETTSKSAKFELYYPLNIKTGKTIDIIKFKGILIEIKNYDDVKALLEDDKIKDKFGYGKKFTKSKYKYVKVTIWARNKNYALETATRYMNLILGFIAYSQNYQYSTITFIGMPKALTELKLNYIFVFKEDEYSGYYYFDDECDDKKVYDLSDSDIQNLNKFVEQFNSADKKIQDVIYKTISLYYQGLIEKRINYSFLNFWTALEIIAIKKKGILHIEIIKRLKSVILKLTLLDEHKIDRIYSLRNNLIHDGAYDISQYDRNILKIYVEIMIEFFIFRLIKFNIQEIQTIFQFLQKDNATLSKSKDLTDFVINLRKEFQNANNNN